MSEKLVLLPETSGQEPDGEERADFDEDNDAAPMKDDEEALRKTNGRKGKSYAERLPKARRTEKLARVTAYCTAQEYKVRNTAAFLKNRHGARTKLYDDCLYAVYHLPLLPGVKSYRVRSSPVLTDSGGKAVLDEEIERSERRDYEEGFFEEDQGKLFAIQDGDFPEESTKMPALDLQRTNRDASNRPNNSEHQGSRSAHKGLLDALTFAEMFVFSYGVVVFWNFTERQEKDILADLTFSESESGVQLMTRPQREEDFETEEFHFQYSPDAPRPRVFNDMITLRSGDHMIKLTMSHAIAQSTKLNFFEQRMADQMAEAQHVPKRLALTGQLGMKREEVFKILGSLFKSRVDVNLCMYAFAFPLSLSTLVKKALLFPLTNLQSPASNMLDVPHFFWESEPTLHPLYCAVREYLEIKPRVQVLNERCRVFLDLAEILSDSIADTKMSSMS